jgi:hypothetical protein
MVLDCFSHPKRTGGERQEAPGPLRPLLSKGESVSRASGSFLVRPVDAARVRVVRPPLARQRSFEPMRNPWVDLPERPPFVLPGDAPHVAACNRFASPTHRLDLRMMPEPWVGDLRAPVVVLNLNPGVGGDEDRRWHRRAAYRETLRATLERRRTQYPLHHLDPALADCPGGRWWRRCLRPVIAATSVDAVAASVVGLEIHSYHSMSYAPVPVTLPSQRYAFPLAACAELRPPPSRLDERPESHQF